MAVILILFSFVLIFVCCGALLPAITSKRVVLLTSFLAFSALVVFSTEVLSVFKAIGYYQVIVWWLIVILITLLYLKSNKTAFADFTTSLINRIKHLRANLTIVQRITGFILAIFLLLILFQGLIYPPNNWDTMTYHLARIVSWLSHHSIAHYPTALTRQIYQPPFAEYLMMHINLLTGSDYLDSTVQLFFLLATLATISLMVEEIGLNLYYQLLAVVIAATIPEVVLQASSTQNDIVISFFVLSGCLFAWKAIRQPQIANFICLGLSVGLGLFTKGTSYIYFAPVLLVFGVAVIVKMAKTKNYRCLSLGILAGLLCLIINASFYYRNYRMAGNLLGVDKQEMKIYSNQKISAGLLFSNMLKNAALHSDVIYGNHLDEKADSDLYRFHRIIGLDINDPAMNYRNARFSAVSDLTGEDSAPNLLHALLFISALIVVLFAPKEKQTRTWLIVLVVVGQYVLLCGYLKWQPWNTRLHTPLFLLMVPFLVYAISLSGAFKKALYVIVPVLLFEGLIICLHNDTKPLNKLSASRYENYFVSKPQAYAEYKKVTQELQTAHYQNVGLLVGEDDWIYPLFTNCYRTTVKPIYLDVHNNTINTIADTGKVDCVISTYSEKKYIDHQGKRFYKVDSTNKIIALYK